MFEPNRRHFLGSAATAAGFAATGLGSMEAQGQAIRPDERRIAPFVFDLEKSPPLDVPADQSLRVVTARQLAIASGVGHARTSKPAEPRSERQWSINAGISAASFRLSPGGFRELHWHVEASEWGYVIDGECRTTVMDPDGMTEIAEYGPGDVWYFPRGYGHSFQCIGKGVCHGLLVFDDGNFQESGTINLTALLKNVPEALLRKNLGASIGDAKSIGKGIKGGLGAGSSDTNPSTAHGADFLPTAKTHKFAMTRNGRPAIQGSGGREWHLDSTDFPISDAMCGVVAELQPGALRELHWHTSADEWHYVLSGKVSVTLFGPFNRWPLPDSDALPATLWREEVVEQGQVAYIPMGFVHSIENVGRDLARVVSVMNCGTYQAIGLSGWLASNPDYLLKEHLGDAFKVSEFPKRGLFISPGIMQ
jgi:oxalate decarboxylase